MAALSARPRRFFRCSCFCSENLFLTRYRLHVRFRGEQQLRRDYGPALRRHLLHLWPPPHPHEILRSLGCRSPEDFQQVLIELEKEVQRRKELARQSVERKAIISQHYRPAHPELYVLQERFLAPEFLATVRYCRSPGANLPGLLQHIDSLSEKRIYRLPVFTAAFCRAFVEELEHFEQSDMPKGRPNTMNNYGVLMHELGLDTSLVTPLREQYLQPLTALLYPDCGGHQLDSHRAFVVKYSLQEDRDLSWHYDNAEVTLNVSLGKDFSQGNLNFGGLRQVPGVAPQGLEVEHVVTRGLLHLGGQMHCALPVAAGERWNLIVWMRASAVRNRLCPMCGCTPDLVDDEGFGDGFTREEPSGTVDVCSLT
ncbi:2-oxoglutarate and iron-dependent oxygenase domain-containing protein 2 isoform X2 [Tachyglossus aculeatus]|uniref:2-oxoglutarate and iron-dependent oxygenase domain-containing protein 2 isoform X2 n=1 Tax=Tachyglossus aculeatus TaxID=9261 RepID=UPI0018F371AE|nr:2-oxoglutarate and iron-dependent oxygenase domain-containing protein 2 isoform X2 [Tachyglossus aculeatus]